MNLRFPIPIATQATSSLVAFLEVVVKFQEMDQLSSSEQETHVFGTTTLPWISFYGESKLPTAASSRILNTARHGTARYCWAGKWVGKELRVVGKYLISASVCVFVVHVYIYI